MKGSFIAVNMFIYCSILAVFFWYWWIYQGSGNANFYYALTLVFAAAQIILVMDLGKSALKLDMKKQNPELNVDDLYQY